VYPPGRTSADRQEPFPPPDQREHLKRTQPNNPDEPTDKKAVGFVDVGSSWLQASSAAATICSIERAEWLRDLDGTGGRDHRARRR
jgi:hypothetical protein